MGLLFKAIVDKGKTFEEIVKFNPYHDAKGRFTTANGAASMTVRTKDPNKQKWADKAVARAKEAEAKNGSAKRIADAENELKGMLNEGVGVNLKGCDPDVAEEAVKSIKQVLEKYPSVKDAFGGFDTEDTPDGCFADKKEVMACYCTDTKKIHLNPDYFGDKAHFERKYVESVQSKFHPEGTDYRSVVVHEMGHAIDRYVSRRIDGVWGVVGPTTSTASKIWNTDIKKQEKKHGGATRSVIRDELSGYGSRNASEYIAEGFAEFMCSANPRATAKSIGRRLTNAINKAAQQKDNTRL